MSDLGALPPYPMGSIALLLVIMLWLKHLLCSGRPWLSFSARLSAVGVLFGKYETIFIQSPSDKEQVIFVWPECTVIVGATNKYKIETTTSFIFNFIFKLVLKYLANK